MGEENAKEAIPKKNWVDDLERTVKESKVSAIRSALSFRQNYQDNVPRAISVFKSYEDAFFHSVEEKLTIAREHPASAAGVVAIAGLILFRGPRRFLFRQTIGRFQSEETKFLKAEKNIKEFNISVDLLKKESGKLLERSSLAERDMKRGHDELMDAGTQLQRLAKTVYKTENQALDLMEVLREIPGREAIRLRAEVASMVQNLKRQRTDLNKRITKISEHGVPV